MGTILDNDDYDMPFTRILKLYFKSRL